MPLEEIPEYKAIKSAGDSRAASVVHKESADISRAVNERAIAGRYDIAIERFVRQGETWMFFFRFEGYIGDEHLISMRDGCAGFFTEAEDEVGARAGARRTP